MVQLMGGRDSRIFGAAQRPRARMVRDRLPDHGGPDRPASAASSAASSTVARRRASSAGCLGGLVFGSFILLGHKLAGTDPKADLPDPQVGLVIVTTVAGGILGGFGGRYRARREGIAPRRPRAAARCGPRSPPAGSHRAGICPTSRPELRPGSPPPVAGQNRLDVYSPVGARRGSRPVASGSTVEAGRRATSATGSAQGAAPHGGRLRAGERQLPPLRRCPPSGPFDPHGSGSRTTRATWARRSPGSTGASPASAATRGASSSWATRQGRTWPRWSRPTRVICAGTGCRVG